MHSENDFLPYFRCIQSARRTITQNDIHPISVYPFGLRTTTGYMANNMKYTKSSINVLQFHWFLWIAHLNQVYVFIVSFLLAGFFLILGIIIWMTYVVDPWTVSYSFGFTVIACILVITAGLLLIPEVDDNRQYWFNIFNKSSRDSSPSTSSLRERSSRSRSRSVSPYPSRRSLRSSTDPRLTPGRSVYDSMPSPAVTDTPRTVLTAGGSTYRPATYNDISNVRLQRDGVGYMFWPVMIWNFFHVCLWCIILFWHFCCGKYIKHM